MGLQSATCRDPQPLGEGIAEVLHVLGTLTLTIFTELGPSRLSMLLDRIAEHELFQDSLTMLD